jgi:Zn-dependent peptidase ImmA (M78 family)
MASVLTNITPEQIGNQLRLARASLDLTLKDVSNRVGLPISTLSDMERGKRQVNSVELFKFSELYNRSIDFFLRNFQSSSSFNLLMRAVAVDSISKETILQFQELCSNYNFIKNIMRTPEMSPPPDYSRTQLNFEDAEDIAEAERSALGLNGQAIKDIGDLLESKRGIKIFHLPGNPDKFCGAFTNDEACGACFLINANNPVRRRNFTIAHEYAHFIAHRDQLAHIDYSEAFLGGNQNERFANAFAAAFLMPRGTILEVLNQLKSKQDNIVLQMLHLAMYFGVSFEAVGWRLVSLRKLTKEKWAEIQNQHVPSSQVARFLGYEIRDTDKPEMLPRQFKYLCYQSYQLCLITFERLAELLQRNYYDLQNEIGIQER